MMPLNQQKMLTVVESLKVSLLNELLYSLRDVFVREQWGQFSLKGIKCVCRNDTEIIKALWHSTISVTDSGFRGMSFLRLLKYEEIAANSKHMKKVESLRFKAQDVMALDWFQ